jgi:hypothetical protein
MGGQRPVAPEWIRVMRYSLPAQTRRIEAVRDLIDTGGPGRIELVCERASLLRLADEPSEFTLTVPLSVPCGEVVFSTWFYFLSLPLVSEPAPFSGTIRSARVIAGDGREIISTLSVGTDPLTSILVVDALDLRKGQHARITKARFPHSTEHLRFAPVARTKRMEVVRELIDATGEPGRIELLGRKGLTSSAHLEWPCGTVEGDVLSLFGMPLITGPAQIEAELRSGQVLDGDGDWVIIFSEGIAGMMLKVGQGWFFHALEFAHS